MSTGHGAWESRIEIGRQPGLGTVATNFFVIPIDGTDSLSFGQKMADRKPVYGGRTRAASSYRKDHDLPGGDIGEWAVSIDENSYGFLRMLDMFYQRGSAISGGTTAPAEWTFTPLGTYTDAASLHLYSIQKAVGDGGTRDERYLDCLGNTMAFKHSTGNPLMLTMGMMSLTGTNLAIAATGSTLLGVPLSTPELQWTLGINGTYYALYPSTESWNETNNLVDVPAAGVAQRARHVIGGHTGDFSLTLPRNNVLAAVQVAYANDYTGTLALKVRSSNGTYSYGGGTLSADYSTYVKFDFPAAPAGGDGELTWEMTGQMIGSPTWVVRSMIATIA
jgi:hypothetical protein